MSVRYDHSQVLSVRKSPEGYLRVSARPARVGIQTYRNADGTERRELRPAEEVFKAESLQGLALAPVTIGHPGLLTAETLKKHRVGMVLGDVRQDGTFVAGTLQIDDAAAVAQVESGALKELSVGYRIRFDATPGTWEGQPYDGVQRDIVANHVALLPAGMGRAGRDCAIRMDADDEDVLFTVLEQDGPRGRKQENRMKVLDREIRVDAADESIVLELVTGLQHKVQATEAELGGMQAKLAKAEARADAAEQHVAASHLVEVQAQAKGLLPEVKFDGKTAAEIKLQAVGHLFPKLRLDGRSEDYVSALFDGALAQPEKKLATEATRQDQDTKPTADQARQEMIERRLKLATGGSK